MVAVLARDAADDGGAGGRRGVQRATEIRPRRRLSPVVFLSRQATGSYCPTSWRSYSRIATFPPGCWVACVLGRRRERPGRGGWGRRGGAAESAGARGAGRALRRAGCVC